jgi:23S rRNA pseudouridine1911/1915/1917 synthase
MNCHIIGDHIYVLSPKVEKSERILLHAYMIYFVHPTSKEKLSFVAPLDGVMQDYLDKKFDMEQINEVMDTSNILRSFSTDS